MLKCYMYVDNSMLLCVCIVHHCADGCCYV